MAKYTVEADWSWNRGHRFPLRRPNGQFAGHFGSVPNAKRALNTEITRRIVRAG